MFVLVRELCARLATRVRTATSLSKKLRGFAELLARAPEECQRLQCGARNVEVELPQRVERHERLPGWMLTGILVIGGVQGDTVFWKLPTARWPESISPNSIHKRFALIAGISGSR